MRPAFASVLAIAALFAARRLLEERMTTQMLLQIPLLVGVGAALGGAMPRRWRALLEPWNRGGVSGFVLATLTLTYWMLPRALDAAVDEPLVDLAKHVSLPLLAGLPIAASWPGAGFIVRGVVLLEFIATFFRLGWLYVVTPSRLCNNYLLDDQRRLGESLLVIGVALSAWAGYRLLWGGSAPSSPGSRLDS